MTAPESPPGLDLAALTAFFDANVPGRSGPLAASLLHGGRSNLTYRVADDANVWVVRRPPLGGLTPSAHDMTREYTVVAGLWDSGVPVPRAVALCEDTSVIGAPFSVVEHVAGTVLRDEVDLDPLSDRQLERVAFGLLEALARLHAVDPADVGLSGFGRPAGYLGRQVRRWWDQWGRVATRELPDIEALHARLAERVPTESAHGIVHGDCRVDNAIFDAAALNDEAGPADGLVSALLDWEMAALGDPLADVGLIVVYRHQAFGAVLGGGGGAASSSARMPSPEAQLEAYAKASRRDLVDMDFYVALGFFKLTVIAEGIHARYVQGQTVGEGFDSVGASVAELAAAGLATLPGG